MDGLQPEQIILGLNVVYLAAASWFAKAKITEIKEALNKAVSESACKERRESEETLSEKTKELLNAKIASLRNSFVDNNNFMESRLRNIEDQIKQLYDLNRELMKGE